MGGGRGDRLDIFGKMQKSQRTVLYSGRVFWKRAPEEDQK